MNEGEVLILGGGPAGMAAAFELHNAGRQLRIIEKNDQVGGLGRTLQHGEFRTDTGPHRFFSQNRYLYDLIEDLLGSHWIKVDRLTRFYIGGKYFSYPVKLKDALVKVGPCRAFRILTDYSFQRIKGRFVKRQPRSFEEYIVSSFGRALAELNMLNYTEKIWGIPCSEISPDWARQRIKGLSLVAVLKNVLKMSGSGPKTLVDQFYYPDEGTGMIYRKIEGRISGGRRNVVDTGSTPVKIRHRNGSISHVVADVRGKRKVYRPEWVISSVPVTDFVRMLEPEAPKSVLEAADRLKFRSHVSLLITIDRPSVFPDQWIYFPDRGIPFGRIMEPRNFSRKMSPPGKTSLLLEFFCWENDRIWKASKEELFEMSIGWLEKLDFVNRGDIIDYYVQREKDSYPVYDSGYNENVDIVKGYMKGIKNLMLIGRGGSFRYNNQDHALEMGILAARSIIEGRKYNIEKVGAEQKYFERGYMRR